jgi:hypothetical protein
MPDANRNGMQEGLTSHSAVESQSRPEALGKASVLKPLLQRHRSF